MGRTPVRRLLPLLVPLLLVLPSSPAAEGPRASPAAGLDADAAAAVREAARWIAKQARPVRGSRGVVFPEYAEGEDPCESSLYAGGAGVLVFLENAASVLGDASIARLADRTAQGLLATATTDGGGRPTWARTKGAAGSAGLYTGDAGVAAAFLVRWRVRDDADALRIARAAADGLLARARRDGDVLSFDTGYDIIAGAAGTALALLEVGDATGEKRYGEAALALARGLARAGTREEGTEEGAPPRLRWPTGAGGTRHYPNFSHGTAGVAYALARVAAATGDAECRDAAVAGGRWLMAHARVGPGTLAWHHYDPGNEDLFMEGWCHGPAGTGRTLLVLGTLTGDPSWTDAARRAAAWIRTEKPLPSPAGKETRFWSPSLCCGAAGVVDFFTDLFRATGDPADRAYARETGVRLLALSKKDGDGRKWTNYDRPDEKGIIYHGTSLMLGTSGEALALLRLAAIDRERDPVVHLPDRATATARFPGTAAPDAAPTPDPAPEPAPAPVPPAPPPPPPRDPLRPVATVPVARHAGGAYVVLTSRSRPGDPFLEAARDLAQWRGGTLVTDFDPARPEAVVPRLRELGARWVALVLPPEEIDANTQRRFLMAAARLDDDAFTDVAWGYFSATARTKPGEMVKRARTLAARGLARRWVSLSVASSIKSTVYPGAGDPTAKRAGWEGRQVYLGSCEADPKVLAFAAAQIRRIEAGGVVQFSGCGDPEGIWLFSDARNGRPEKHWPFDPKKVGDDPAGEMPRLTAPRLAGLRLDGTVVWTGVCHTGSLVRVFVEGDIVSTFGVVDGTVEYRIPPGRSVAGAILDAGAAAFIAPLGPNHGYRSLVEAEAALEGRLALGDILRSTWDDIAMAQGGAPTLGLHGAGDGSPDRGAVAMMQGGGANRVLYGDPALAPFAKESVAPAVAVERTDLPGGGGAFTVRASVREKDWGAWDMFASDSNAERIRAVVELSPETTGALAVTATATGTGGKPVVPGRVDALVEAIDGKLLLHLQAAAPRGSGLGEPGSGAVFTVTPTGR